MEVLRENNIVVDKYVQFYNIFITWLLYGKYIESLYIIKNILYYIILHLKMSKYYGTYSQYLGAQRCCNLKLQGPQGQQGPILW